MMRISTERRYDDAKNEHLEEFARIYNFEMGKVRAKDRPQLIPFNKYQYDKVPVSNLHSVGSNIINSVKVQKNINIQKEVDRFSSELKNSKFNQRYENPQFSSPKRNFRRQKGADSPRNGKQKNKFVSRGFEESTIGNPQPDNNFSSRPTDQSKNAKDTPVFYSSENLKKVELDHERFIKVEDECLAIHLKLVEIWLEIENNVDIRNNLSLALTRYLKENEMSFLYNNLSNDLFHNNLISKHFTSLYKLSLLCVLVIKFLIFDYNFDSVQRLQIKKMISSISESFCIIYDKFAFLGLSKSFSLSNKTLMEKLQVIARSNTSLNKQSKKNKVTETILYLQKSNDNTITALKLFSTNNFKVGFFNPLHNVLNELLTKLEEMSFSSFYKFVFDNVLFSLIRKDEKSSKNYDIDFKKEMSVSNTVPYLPAIDKKFTYTLVLDLDETLVHFFYTSTGGTFFIRPCCQEFLKELCDKYEIVIFTAATKDYADNILNLIDPNFELIQYRLYRQHCTIAQQTCIKDLTKLGRDLKKLVMIDNIPENFQLQPDNGLSITTWKDDLKDQELSYLIKILAHFVDEKIDDVTKKIKVINDMVNNKNYTYATIHIQSINPN